VSAHTKIVVVYHSASGRTRALAEACGRGARSVDGAGADVTPVDLASRPEGQAVLAAADAIVFGCPTYMGSVSGAFKTFMDATAAVWAVQGWRDKIAAGFTHSAAPSGDKMNTLIQLAVFAAQHGMIWVGLGLPPTYALPSETSESTNRLGSHLGAMAQSRPGGGALPESDLKTAEHLGRRVAEAAARWRREPRRTASAGPRRHPTTHAWVFPAEGRVPLPLPLERTNLRELAAGEGRFEHHLMPCATAGGAQLEIVAASEPLAFAHANVSDEYAVALPCGDDLVEQFPLRTFLSDAASGADIGRYNHRTFDLVLHPYGALHWPGRLRAPHDPIVFPPGMRRSGLALVYCASRPTLPTVRPLGASAGREGDAKAYVDPSPPMFLASLRGEPGILARIGTTTLALLVAPKAIEPPCGGYVIILEVDENGGHAPGDLVRVPPGGRLDGSGIARALLFSADDAPPDPVPALWRGAPRPPFPPYEDLPAGALPVAEGGLSFEKISDRHVALLVGGLRAEVHRYWLARMLFRSALHGFALGYVETYGGAFVDDREGRVRVGLRAGGGTPNIELSRVDAIAFIERVYRAVAPPGYRERLD
jgi:multimeric flavodoxin WrbA